MLIWSGQYKAIGHFWRDYPFKLADPENHTREPTITILFCVQPEMSDSLNIF